MDIMTAEALEAGLDVVRGSPVGVGVVELVVRRPGVDAREVLAEGALDLVTGLAGDSWEARGNRRTVDGSADPEGRITVMNARVAALLAGSLDRWALAGDQLYVDLDLSIDSLPAGAHLEVGAAVIEVSTKPHTGCTKFADRFGVDALRFVNSAVGRELRLRGLNAKVVRGGVVRPGDVVKRVPSTLPTPVVRSPGSAGSSS